MRLRILIGSIVALIAVLLLVDATAYRGHYRKAAWHELELRAGFLHPQHKGGHPKRAAADPQALSEQGVRLITMRPESKLPPEEW
jgi:hypothetical protein